MKRGEGRGIDSEGVASSVFCPCLNNWRLPFRTIHIKSQNLCDVDKCFFCAGGISNSAEDVPVRSCRHASSVLTMAGFGIEQMFVVSGQ